MWGQPPRLSVERSSTAFLIIGFWVGHGFSRAVKTDNTAGFCPWGAAAALLVMKKLLALAQVELTLTFFHWKM